MNRVESAWLDVWDSDDSSRSVWPPPWGWALSKGVDGGGSGRALFAPAGNSPLQNWRVGPRGEMPCPRAGKAEGRGAGCGQSAGCGWLRHCPVATPGREGGPPEKPKPQALLEQVAGRRWPHCLAASENYSQALLFSSGRQAPSRPGWLYSSQAKAGWQLGSGRTWGLACPRPEVRMILCSLACSSLGAADAAG